MVVTFDAQPLPRAIKGFEFLLDDGKAINRRTLKTRTPRSDHFSFI
jgi:hypothetical protein